MKINPIRTKKDYHLALQRVDKIFDSKKGTSTGNELEILSILIDVYESQHFPIENPEPIEAIKFRMEQMGLDQNELSKIIGLKSRASEILNKKRKLNLAMIRKLVKALDIPSEILIKPY